MPAAALKQPKPVTKMSRRELAQELVGIHRDNAAMFARIDDLKSALKSAATKAGENFKEEFPGIGAVKVSRAKDKEFKGTMPELAADVFLALPEKDKAKLTDKGVVMMTKLYSNPYYGSVTVDLF